MYEKLKNNLNVRIKEIDSLNNSEKTQKKVLDKVQNTIWRLKTKSIEQNLPFDLDLNYLLSIFPWNLECPALGTPLSIKSGTKRDKTIALDRIIPEFGYVNSNVAWISMNANYAKSDLNPNQMFQFHDWYIDKTDSNYQVKADQDVDKILYLYNQLKLSLSSAQDLKKLNDSQYLNNQRNLKNKIRINSKTNKPYEIGDIENGMILYEFGKYISKKEGPNKGYLVEKWHSTRGKRRINQTTNQYFETGDVRSDGRVFSNYELTESKILRNGYFHEYWHSPEKYLEKCLKRIIVTKKIGCRKFGIPFEVDLQYLMSIFPKDYLCPVFKTQMSFGNKDRSNSPSLDRFDSTLGYVEGNIHWISMKANWTKSNLNFLQIHFLFDWYREAALSSLLSIEKEKIR